MHTDFAKQALVRLHVDGRVEVADMSAVEPVEGFQVGLFADGTKEL